jgi:DNA repair exonuclease SbcCD ATPase subunit
MQQLSGGQKALVALALIFAIQRFVPCEIGSIILSLTSILTL